MASTRKAPTAAKKPRKPRGQDLAEALAEREAELAEARHQNARLIDQLQAKTHDLEEALEQQKATADVLKVINRSAFDLDPVFDALLASAVSLVGGTGGTICVRDHDVFRYRAVAEGRDSAIWRYISEHPATPGRASVAGRVLLSGKPETISDTLSDRELKAPVHSLTGARSVVGVPLLREHRIEGALMVARAEAGPFDSQQIDVLQTFADQAVIAINNVRLFRETQEALRQQTATSDILRVIASSPNDLQPVLERIVETACRLCSAYDAVALLREGDQLRIVAHDGPIPITFASQQINREWASGRAVIERRTIHIDDIAERADEYPVAAALASRGLAAGSGEMLWRANLVVPLMREGEAIGVIGLRRAEAVSFSEGQIELLKTFSDQAVIAIENARLFDEVQAKTRDLEESLQQQTATADVLKVISRSAFDLQAVFDALISSAVNLIGGQHGTIYVRDGENFRIRAHFGVSERFVDFLARNPPAPGMGSASGRVMLTGKVVVIPDILEDKDYAHPANELNRTRSMLAAPLLSNDRLEGVLVIARTEPGAFSSRQIELVQTFADQAVIAIENARLFDEVQAKTRDLEESLQQQTATANVLKVISRSAFDLDAVLKTLTESAHALSGAATATVFLHDGEVLRIRAESGVAPEFLEYLVANPIPPGRETVTGRVLMTGETVLVPDVLADPDYNYGAGPRLGNYRTLLGVPLIRDGKVEGVFGLQGREPGAFAQRQIELVRTFADQAVIAIGNVRLFDEVQAKTRDLEESLQQQTATADVLKAISRSAFDLDTVLETLIATAMRLCDATHGGEIFRRHGDVYRYAASRMNTDPAYLHHERAAEIAPGRGTLVGRVALENRTVQIVDAWNDPEYAEKEEARIGNVRAMLGVPLMRDGEMIGAFALGRAEPIAFTQRQVELVTTFADQAVIAIENVRLFDEVQAKTRDLEESLQQQTATADVLKVISRSAFDLQTVLDTLASSATGLIGADFAVMYLRRDDGIRAEATFGCAPELVQYLADHPQKPGRKTLAGRVFMSGEVHNIPDVLADPEYDFGAAPKVGNFRALLGAPMFRDGKVEGSFTLGRREPGSFTQRQISIVQTFADQAVIAIENVRLFTEVQAKTRDLEEALQQQTATADVLKVISRSAFDLQTVLESLISTAVRLCDARYGEIFRRHGDVYRFAATHAGAEPAYIEHELKAEIRPGRDTLIGRVALERRAIEIADAWSDPEYVEKDEARVGNLRAMLGVPLMRAGEPIGAFALARSMPQPFTERQVELVTTFADQAVIAIENVRLFDEVQAKTRDLSEALQQQTATAEVLKVISRSTFDLNAVLTILVQSARDLCNAPQCMLFLRENGLYCCAMQVGWPPEVEQYFRDNPIPPGPYSGVGRVAITGQVAHFPDVLADPDYRLPGHQSRALYRTLLSVPLLRAEEVIGVFSLCRPKPDPFTEREIELVKTFADQAVIAIENVRLFDEVQARTRDLQDALQQQTATANVLKVISRSAFDLQAVLTTLAESARELCGASFVTLFMRDGDEMRLRAESGCTPEIVAFLHAHPIRAGRETFTGRVMLSGEAVHLPDVLADPEYDFGDAPRIGNYRTLLGVPLLRDGQVEGVFSLARPEPAPFTARQIEMVRAFADQAVIAIENARLFGEVQARTRELSASLDDLRRAQDRLIQSEKLASLGQLTAGIAHEIKNPLNFINNYSALSRELVDELAGVVKSGAVNEPARGEADELIGAIGGNLDKVVQHGKRADSIVKNMLLHSREGSGERSTTDVNAMVEEALNLAYHGARAERPGFNVTIVKSLDPNAGAAEVYAQEMTRVLLNLISNGFYATNKRKQSAGSGAYEPTISASTRDLGPKVEIAIRDNGTGIPDEVKAKMFNPFFTTKPAGEGTGLGLSLSHDIVVKQHGGAIEVSTEPDAFTEFTIVLPRGAAQR